MANGLSRSFPPLAEPDVPSQLLDYDGELEDDDGLEGVRLAGSWMNEELEGIEISGSCLAGARLTGATLERLVLRDVVVVDCELSGV